MKLDYFVSLANEICVRDLRLKKLISSSYRVGSFPFSATAFRAVLQNFIPEHLGLGQGVVLGSNEKNFLSEILLYKKNSFHLYKEGELLVLPADAILASIIVRSDLSSVNSNLEDWLELSKEISGFSAYFSWDSGVLGLDRAVGLLNQEKEYLGNTLLVPNPESVLVQDEESLLWEKARLADFLASDNPALASLLFRLYQFLINHSYLRETQAVHSTPTLGDEMEAIKLAAISEIPQTIITEKEQTVEEAIDTPVLTEESPSNLQNFTASQLFSVKEEFGKEKEEEKVEEVNTEIETTASEELEKEISIESKSNFEEKIDPIAYLDTVLESTSKKPEVSDELSSMADDPETSEEQEEITEIVLAENQEINPIEAPVVEGLESEAKEKLQEEINEEEELEEEEFEEENILTKSVEVLSEIDTEAEVEVPVPESESEKIISAIDPAPAKEESQQIDFVSGMPIEDFDSSPELEAISPISTDLDSISANQLIEESMDGLPVEKEEMEEVSTELVKEIPTATEVAKDEVEEVPEVASPIIEELGSKEEAFVESILEKEDEISDNKISEDQTIKAELEKDLNLEELLADVSLNKVQEVKEGDVEKISSIETLDDSSQEGFEKKTAVEEVNTKDEILVEEAPLFDSSVIEEIKDDDNPEFEDLEEELGKERVEQEPVIESTEVPKVELEEIKKEAVEEIQEVVSEMQKGEKLEEPIKAKFQEEDEKAASIDPVQKSTLASEVKALSMDAPPIPRKSGLEGKFVPKNRRNMKKRTPGMGPMKNHASTISPKDRASLDLNKPESKRAKKAQLYLQENEQGNYPVHLAVINNDLKALRLILREGEQTELKNKKGYTPLHFAAELNLIEIALLLLEQSANVNSRTFIYDAPIHLAVLFDNHEMVRVLIEHGAEVEVRNNRGNTPMHRAARFGSYKSAKLLIDNFADIHARMERDLQPLHLAAWYGNNEMVQLFVDEGAELNAINSDGNTALHFAAFNGQVKIIKTLINNKADTNIENLEGETYLQGINEGYQGQMTAILN
ncbi:MAG: ankyrin repeat domain-containing protein [Bacteroidota bacterium]